MYINSIVTFFVACVTIISCIGLLPPPPPLSVHPYMLQKEGALPQVAIGKRDFHHGGSIKHLYVLGGYIYSARAEWSLSTPQSSGAHNGKYDCVGNTVSKQSFVCLTTIQ